MVFVSPFRMGGHAERRVPVTFTDKVTFLEKVAKEEPLVAPPAPARVAAPPVAPAAAAPVVRLEQKVRELEKPPVPRQLRAPRALPTATPREVDPSEDKGVAVVGPAGQGDTAGLEGGVSRGGVIGGEVGGAIELPDEAVPPRLAAGSAVPPYPPEARAARRTGVVVLRVVVFADGTVGKVEVISGEEPFVTAATQAVKSWRYQPARLKGQPIAVYRLIRIPFELRS